MSRPRAFLISIFSFLCVSCTTALPRPPADQLQQLWQARAPGLLTIQHWELRGRLAVRADERGGQVSVLWRRDGERHSIRLSGPLGRGVLHLTQDESGAQLQDAEQQVLRAASGEELLFRYTGWRLPVANLNYWVRGLPAPDVAAVTELDDLGRLKTLHQQAWQVHYEEYARVEGNELPSRLRLTSAANVGSGQPAMDVRLVIERWAQVQ